ncbi:MAG TPA: phosphomethylpyrimidine synthase ThiC, partial [Tepidisphaeraceae bacterium]
MSLTSTHPLPAIGGNPSNHPNTTNPGSFANPRKIYPGARGALTYSSPDTPGQPPVSSKSAWDFLPDGWQSWEGDLNGHASHVDHDQRTTTFVQCDGTLRTVVYPAGFEPITQLESARLGIVTPQMKRVAEREPHLTPEEIRDEVGAGRMVIPANIKHLEMKLDPMCIGRASKTKVNANLGASPVSSDINEELEKIDWALKYEADTLMDLSTGGDLNATRAAFCKHSTAPIGTVPIYSMIIGRKIEDLDWPMIEAELINQAEQGVDYFTIHAGV